MRTAFIDTLCEMAAVDERIVLLTGDLGYMLLERFRDRFPGRFINVGVAEQNMIAVATGLAEAGLLPYAYSIATFAALRPFEFIRNGPVSHCLPVRIVGVGAGFGYGPAGATHHGIEDVAALRTLPGLTIVVPADSCQASAAIRSTANHAGPIYYSLSKDETEPIRGLEGRFELGRVQQVRRGVDLAVVAMGSIVSEVVIAAEELSSRGLEASVFVVSNFHPDPTEDLARLLVDFPRVIGIEAQAISGGLCAFLGTLIASHSLQCRFTPLAVRRPQDGKSGSERDCWRRNGINAGEIIEALAIRTESVGR
jgi:transketolase